MKRYFIVLLFSGVLLAATPDSPKPEDKPTLTDYESLKGTDILLQYEKDTNQLLMLQNEAKKIQEDQTKLRDDMVKLNKQVLLDHKLDEKKWSINWDAKTINLVPDPPK